MDIKYRFTLKLVQKRRFESSTMQETGCKGQQANTVGWHCTNIRPQNAVIDQLESSIAESTHTQQKILQVENDNGKNIYIFWLLVMGHYGNLQIKASPISVVLDKFG